MKTLVKSPYFWSALLMALVASICAFAPQIISLFHITAVREWQLNYLTAAHRLLLPLAGIAIAWRFGILSGLVACLVVSPVVLAGVAANYSLPNASIDIIDVILSLALSWLVGRQSEMTHLLKETSEQLRLQTESVKLEAEERRQAESQYRLIAEHSADIIYRISIKEERFTYVSPSAYRILGYTEAEARAMKLTDILTPESYRRQREEMIEDLKTSRSSATIQLDLYHKDGHIVPFEARASFVYDPRLQPAEIIGVARDITERRKMEEQVMVQNRLASIGQLTSGLAHELNNPLTSIISLSAIHSAADLPDDVKQDFQIINDEAQRIAGIIKGLQTMTRKQPLEKQPADVNDSIRKVMDMRAYEQKVNNITAVMNLAAPLPRVFASAAQLEQVFFNIIINAEYFMLEAHHRGTLTVTTEKAGDSVRIAFKDDGPGIPPENLPRIFAPFFSTKAAGKGMGLSLSICQGIIHEHGGRLYAESEPGRGAAFIIELPVLS